MAVFTIFSCIAAVLCVIITLSCVLSRRSSSRKRVQPVVNHSILYCEVCSAAFHDEELYRRHTESPLCADKRGAADSQTLSSVTRAKASETESSACLPTVRTEVTEDNEKAECSDVNNCYVTRELSTEASVPFEPARQPEDLDSPCEPTTAQQLSGVLTSAASSTVESDEPNDVADALERVQQHDECYGHGAPIEVPQSIEFPDESTCSSSQHEPSTVVFAEPALVASTSVSNLAGSQLSLSSDSVSEERGEEVDEGRWQDPAADDLQLVEIQEEPRSSSSQLAVSAIASAQPTSEASIDDATEDFCEEGETSAEQDLPADLEQSISAGEPQLPLACEQGSSAELPSSLEPTCSGNTPGVASAWHSDDAAMAAPAAPASATNSNGVPAEPSTTGATAAGRVQKAKKNTKAKKEKEKQRKAAAVTLRQSMLAQKHYQKQTQRGYQANAKSYRNVFGRK